MKIRSDFVSNSSSSSFILHEDDAARGIHLLKHIVESCEIPWEVENEISLYVHAKNKYMRELSKMLGDEYDPSRDAREYSQHVSRLSSDELSWHSVEIPLSESGLNKLTDEALSMVDNIEFYLSDGHSLVLVLKLLYLFFQKSGCNPDARDSEQNFLFPDSKEDFMYALVYGIDSKKGRTE